MTRTELIAALEAAEGPSREFDEEIFIQITPGVLEAGRIDRGSAADLPGHVGWWPRDTTYQSTRAVPHYTESIDAALSFTPEGYHWAVLKLSDNAYDAAVTPKGEPPLVEERESATPAIALCIANLRALDQEKS